jgi:hypothetical protein
MMHFLNWNQRQNIYNLRLPKTITKDATHTRQQIEITSKDNKDTIAREVENAQNQIHATVITEMEMIQEDTTLCNRVEEGKTILTIKVNMSKQELQGNKDHTLQTIQNKCNRLIQDVMAEATATTQTIQQVANDMITSLQQQGTKTTSLDQPSTPPWHKVYYRLFTPQHHNNTFTSQTNQTQEAMNPARHNNSTTPKHNFQERIEGQDMEIEEDRIQERSCYVMDKLYTFKKSHVDHYITGPNPNQEDIKSLYRALANEMCACQIPIISFDQLTPTSGTSPLNKRLTPEVESVVNCTLFNQLRCAIPTDVTQLKAILDSYAHTEDGYGALFLSMTNNLSLFWNYQPLNNPIPIITYQGKDHDETTDFQAIGMGIIKMIVDNTTIDWITLYMPNSTGTIISPDCYRMDNRHVEEFLQTGS